MRNYYNVEQLCYGKNCDNYYFKIFDENEEELNWL